MNRGGYLAIGIGVVRSSPQGLASDSPAAKRIARLLSFHRIVSVLCNISLAIIP
jgi:hypothetical protein